MRRRYRALLAVLGVVFLALVTLGVVISYESPCGPPDPVPEGATRMKAVLSRCYGLPDVLTLEEIAKPTAADDEVLVKVHAAALNPLDWHSMRGKPYIMRLSGGLGAPKDASVGVDFAGTVEAVGRNVTRFKPGDAVFGGRSGSVAEYVAVREHRTIALKPANVTFEQAGAVAIAGITALQALRDHGRLQPGQKVLINGASGGVGTFAVQIAKSFGAEVTGVCSTRNVELVRSIGADHVIDYTQQDFTEGQQRYDVIVDNVGNHSISAYRRVLNPQGRFVIVGGPTRDPWIEPFMQPIKASLVSPFVSQELGMMMTRGSQQDLELLGELMQAGKVTPVIDRRYALSDAPTAIRYLGEGRARGKVVISPIP